jgi:FKBP-type peptidyl-prolyl cis-trans isomerase
LPRSFTVPALVLATALALTACGGPSPEPTADPETPVVEIDLCATGGGEVVDSVAVSGEFGQEPVLDYTVPVAAPESTQRTILIDGGVEVAPGANVEALYTIIDGTTGEVLDASDYASGAGVEFRADLSVLREGFARTLACVGPGSRVVGVIPADEGFGSDAAASGLGADDVVIFVADVIADLSPAEWTTDVAEVGGSDDAPTITVPAVAPKPDLEMTVLEEGDGPVVGAGDTVSVDYYGVAWDTGEMFDESFSKEPYTLPVLQFVPGFSNAIIGQKVGTRLLVTIPPSLAYGEAGESTHELAGKTLVFLVDIVDTTPAG